jgi:tryptophanyl-tRNA synthetase
MNRVLSGIQPTSKMHLGNYLGAVRNWVGLQQAFETLYCVVDLHALTLPQIPAELQSQSRELAATLLAVGIDPQRSTLFLQSQVAPHSELAWLFSCLTPISWLSRMTQFKEKAGKQREHAMHGLFAYPVLMAADILVYHATHVPVGEDQKQHLELTREIAGKFNHQYGVEYFPVPKPQIFGAATRVMSLRDGTKKMSKSDSSDYSRINMTDDADTISKKVRKAKTDSSPLPATLTELINRPEAENLINIYAALVDQTPEQVLQDLAGTQFSVFKARLAEAAVSTLTPIARKIKQFLADPSYVDSVLREGSIKARTIAAQTLADVQKIVGILQL